MSSVKKSPEKKIAQIKKKLIIVHGFEGSPENGWLPWLKGEVERKGWEAHAPPLPNTNDPKVHEWLPALIQATGEVDENTYMVGHSLGCITILRFLETLKDEESIGGAVLVAGFDNPLGNKRIDDFFQAPVNWEKAKRVCKKFVVIHSEDDPYVPADNGVRLKNNLGAKKILVSGYRHFSGDEGVTSLPLVLRELLEISASAK